VGLIHPASDPERPKSWFPDGNKDIVLIYSIYSVGSNLACSVVASVGIIHIG
jgi:hypothetical protein